MRHLVIGRGEVGKALIEVLDARYVVRSLDQGECAFGRFDAMHICIPYNKQFDRAVKSYLEEYLAPGGLTIIHSTVPVGTSNAHLAVHSPIRGVHPNLADGIRTFTKFFGGPRAEEAASIFRALGITCSTTPSARNTEAMKLWDTTYYGWNIVFEKAVKAYCDEHGLDFDLVYTRANETYNYGYALLGKHDVQRPVLKHVEGPIGGHCVIPNAKILRGFIANYILEMDAAEYQKEAA